MVIACLCALCILLEDEFWKGWYDSADTSIQVDLDFAGGCVLSFEKWLANEFSSSDWERMLERMAKSNDYVEVFALFAASSDYIYGDSPFETVDDDIEVQLQRQLVRNMLDDRFLHRYHQFGVWTNKLKFHGIAAGRHCIEWSSIERERSEVRRILEEMQAKESVAQIVVCKRIIELFHLTGCHQLIRRLDLTDLESAKALFAEWDRWVSHNRSNLLPSGRTFTFSYSPCIAQFVYQSQRLYLWVNAVAAGEESIELLLMPPCGPYFVFGYPDVPFCGWDRGPVQRLSW